MHIAFTLVFAHIHSQAHARAVGKGLHTMTTKRPVHRRPATLLGGITLTRIVREHIPMQVDDSNGIHTVGSFIDEHLASSASRGESIQSVELNFEPDQWEALATAVYCGYVDPTV